MSSHKRVINMSLKLYATIGCLCLTSCLVFLCTTKQGTKFLKWSCRKVLVQFSDILNFQDYHRHKCLVSNYLNFPDVIEEDICDLCENIDTVMYLSCNKSDDINGLNKYLKLRQPVVFENDTRIPEMPMDTFVENILSSERLAMFHPCQFQSNWKSMLSDHWALMEEIGIKEVTSYYAIWENCVEETLKEFRQFYQRPSFLASNIQLSGTSWIVLCSDFNGKVFRSIKTFTPLSVVMVLRGHLTMDVKSLGECREMCTSLPVSLKSGNVLIVSTEVYSVSVLPHCRGQETIAIGIGAFFD